MLSEGMEACIWWGRFLCKEQFTALVTNEPFKGECSLSLTNLLSVVKIHDQEN